MSTAVTSVEVLPADFPVPDGTEHCDRCGARAFVRSLHADGPLDWCGHHFATNEEALRKTALGVLDNRHVLIEEEANAS